MLWKTHSSFSIFVALIVCIVFNIKFQLSINIIYYLIILIISSLLPDIDHPNSKIRRMFYGKYIIILLLIILIWHTKNLYYIYPLILTIIAIKSEHRSFSHSILGLILFSIFFYNSYIFIPFIIGYSSHLIGDMIYGKIKLLYPLDRRIGLNILKTGQFETTLQIIFIFLSYWLLVIIQKT